MDLGDGCDHPSVDGVALWNMVGWWIVGQEMGLVTLGPLPRLSWRKEGV